MKELTAERTEGEKARAKTRGKVTGDMYVENKTFGCCRSKGRKTKKKT